MEPFKYWRRLQLNLVGKDSRFSSPLITWKPAENQTKSLLSNVDSLYLTSGS